MRSRAEPMERDDVAVGSHTVTLPQLPPEYLGLPFRLTFIAKAGALSADRLGPHRRTDIHLRILDQPASPVKRTAMTNYWFFGLELLVNPKDFANVFAGASQESTDNFVPRPQFEGLAFFVPVFCACFLCLCRSQRSISTKEELMTRLTTLCFAFLAMGFCGSVTWGAQLFAIQDQNSDVLVIDTNTGVAVSAFSLPSAVPAGLTDGLTLAENGTSLLFVGNNDPTSPLYRLNPQTGSVLSSHELQTITGFRAGLTFDSANDNSIFVVDNGLGVGQQAGFDGAYTPSFVYGGPSFPGALGGDDFGRHFVNDFTGMIQEFSPVDGATLNFIPDPSPNLFLGGLAFDGEFLYAVDDLNQLYTLDPDSGAVLSSVLVTGGNGGMVSGLAATVPEPSAWALGVFLLAFGLLGRRRMA